jgi:BirA family transcriptional regulator, biotin operon repressor / biotin---[acetyl-CoA-carboxylase] ligase
MPLIKLSAIASTSTYLKERHRRKAFPDYTVVLTDDQTEGRGQMQAQWVSEPYKNLTFSILKIFTSFPNERQFLMTMAVSLALYKVLKDMEVPQIAIKWPNDIMSGSKKLCGILLENTWAKGEIAWSVIGVGLNVNQVDFPDGLKATSLKTVLGHHVPLDGLFHEVEKQLRQNLQTLEASDWDYWYPDYYHVLFRKEVVSTFATPTGALVSGIIIGVSPDGRLCIKLENGERRYFGLKELKLLN